MVKIGKLGLAGLLGLFVFSAQAGAASAYPYPQNRTYAYGGKPNFAGSSWANDNANILTKWNAWKAANVTASGAGGFLRVQRPSNGNDTVSEGISYGMIMAVYFDDQATFNGLWQYKQIHNDGLGLMNWNINSGGGTQNGNSATDADEDIAYALYLAFYQWGNGAFNYKNLADAEVLKLKSYDLDGNNRVKPGDSFSSCQYPSYLFPNEYAVFGKQTSDTFTWNQVITSSYNAINSSRDNGTGLIAEQCQMGGGIGGGCGVSSNQYQYNSCRVPFRMALDYVYYGTGNANTELTKLHTFFNSIAANSVADCYNITGGACGGFNNAAFEGPAATSFMNGGASLQNYYNQLMSYNDNSYYSGALQLLTLLLLSGNMPNIADPGAMYTPTITPSPTIYAGTPTFTATQTPIAYGIIFEDFEAGSLAGAYSYTGTTPSSMAYSDSTLAANSGTYAMKLLVNVSSGQYAGVGFSSNYANGQGVVDSTGANAIRFAIKTDATVTFTLQIREAGNTTTALAGGDGELWDSPPITVFAGPGWTTKTISLVSPAFTEDLYSSNGAAGNNTLNLSAVKVIQLNFSTVVAGANVYFDDIAFVPSVAPTPTFTKTPFNNPYSQLYDDMESPMSISVPARAGTYADGPNGASASWSINTGTVADGLNSAKLTYNTGNASSYGCGGFDISPYGTPSLYVDASGAVTLGYWINATAGLKYKMEFQEAGTPTSPTAGADGEAWLSPLLTAAGGWQWVQVDIASFTEDPYNTVCNPTGITAPGPCFSGPKAGNGTQDVQAISSVTVKLNGNQGAGALYLDDITFITTFKTPTPSASPSASQSPTRTPSASASPSPSPSVTPSVTPSATPSQTSTVGSSSTFTASSTPSGTPTDTRTASPTRTATASVTPSVSPSATRTNSPVLSATDTPTATPSNTIGIPSLTNTPVNSFTSTVTPPNTFSSTVTLTDTPTLSSTMSATASSTQTPGPSFTSTNTPLPGSTFTDTSTVSATSSSTQTPLPGSTFTSTATPSMTPSYDAWDPTDDVQGGATSIPFPVGAPNVSAGHFVGYGSDGVDWFSATLTAGHHYSFTVNVLSGGATLSMKAYDPAMTLLVSNTGGGGTTSMTVSTSGTYYFKMSDTNASKYDFSSVDDNDSTATSTQTPLPGTSTFTPTDTPTFTSTATSTFTCTVTATPSRTITPTFTDTTTPVTAMITDLAFTWSPNQITVTVGTNVTWAWVGTHDVQSDTNVFSSGGPATGGNFNFTFNTPGTYPYYCTLHGGVGGTGMHGVIYVTAPTATPTPPPVVATTVPTDAAGATGPIVSTVPYPNPNPGAISVQLNRSVDKVTLKVYSESMVCLDNISSGPSNAGWATIGLPPTFLQTATSGTYYYVVSVEKNGSNSRVQGVGKMMFLR